MKIASLLIVSAFAFATSALAEKKKVDTKAAAAKIDALIAKNYAPNKITPNPITDDSTFVRRAYLDIAGRIPTAAEARVFLDSMEPTRRADLIDQLLDSEGYVSHQFNYWADVLRVTSRMNGQSAENGPAYINWIKGSIRDNKPYDEFVRELVTADGMIDLNGAVGFYLRDRGMALDHLATTVQVFLGTQMVCAQCHDHPFDEWTQMDYYELAAFSTPVDVQRGPDNLKETIAMLNKRSRQEMNQVSESSKKRRKGEKNKGKLNKERGRESKERREISNRTRDQVRTLTRLGDNFRNSAVTDTDKTLKLPDDYQYNDAEPKDVVHARTPFGETITVSEGESRIDAYADWMTSKSNPRFTKTIANRLWKRAMGIGLIEPVDNLRDDTVASNPELMAYLEKLLKDLDYDLKAYYRVIYNSKTYQREAESADMLAKYYYPGPRLRRMSAEQVWDSVVTLIRGDVADTAKNPRAINYTTVGGRLDAWNRFAEQSPEALLKRGEELAAFNKKTTEKIDRMREQADKAIASKDAKKAGSLAVQLLNFNRDATLEYARLTYWDINKTKGTYFRPPFRRTPQLIFRQLKTAFPKQQMPDERQLNQVASNSGEMMMSSKGQKQKQKNPEREKARQKAEMKRLRNEMGKEAYEKMVRKQSADKRLRSYVRASEMPSPAPDGHFLRTFGQSDRQLIENANDEASVPQALALMNGNILRTVADQYSALTTAARAAGDDQDALLDALFMSTLTREPSEAERSLLREELESSKNQYDAIRGITWTLLNTQQFLFIQ